MILVAVGLVVAALGATWISARRQQSALAADIERLVRGGAAHGVAAPADAQVLERLPPPVARYLRLALPSPKHIQEVRIWQTGTPRTDATSERWTAAGNVCN
jgi:hypothetical protein